MRKEKLHSVHGQYIHFASSELSKEAYNEAVVTQ